MFTVSLIQKLSSSFLSKQELIISTISILGSIFVIKKFADSHLQKGIKIVIIGSIIQIFAGLGDSISYDVFGIDGLVSWSYQPLEFGLILCALCEFLIIKSRNEKQFGFGKDLLV